jgi:hypothetical protein
MASTKTSISKSEKRHLLWREIDSMQHRRPEPGCPLCTVWGIPYVDHDKATHGRQHLHAELLWNEWDGRPRWDERVAAAAAEIGVECTPAQARRHFTRHQIEQPARSKRLNREQAMRTAYNLSERQREIVRAVFRQRSLTRDEILDLFYLGHYAEESADRTATRDLAELVRLNFLVRWYPPVDWTTTEKERFLRGQVFYFLGREATPWVEQADQAKIWKSSYIVFAREVGRQQLVHDTRSSDLYAALARSLNARQGQVETAPGAVTSAFLNQRNWYGPRHLSLRFWDPRAQRQIAMSPDGFATISLARSGYGAGAVPACQLPFFYEFDYGSRQVYEVSRQLLQYHNLARSGLATRLFPDLHVADLNDQERSVYAVPLVMVFRNEDKLEEVRASFRNRATRNGYKRGVPIFLTTEREWLADAFAPGILRDAWEGKDGERRLSLVEGLIAASQRLLEPLCLFGPNDTLRYDPTVIPRLQPDLQPKSTRYWH